MQNKNILKLKKILKLYFEFNINFFFLYNKKLKFFFYYFKNFFIISKINLLLFFSNLNTLNDLKHSKFYENIKIGLINSFDTNIFIFDYYIKINITPFEYLILVFKLFNNLLKHYKKKKFIYFLQKYFLWKKKILKC